MADDDDVTLDSIAAATFDELSGRISPDAGAPSEDEEDSDDSEEGDYEDSEDAGSGREGTDKVLARLKSADPAAYRAVREMQQKMSRNINETSTLQQQLVDALERIADRRPREEAEVDKGPTLPDGVTDENIKVFKQVADYLGYVPREELDSRDKERTAGNYVRDALTEGVETFGEEFGEVAEDGSIQVNPELRTSLQKHLDRLQDGSRGITPFDLFLLEKGRQALAQARRASSQPRDQRAGAPARRAVQQSAVARRTGGSGQKISIYDAKRGDSGEDVFARAWALARRGVKNT